MFPELYRGVQGVLGCIREIPEVQRGFQGVSRGVQGCTGVFRVFQGVSRGSEGFLHFLSRKKTKTFLLLTFIAKRGKGYCKTRQLYWMILLLENEAKVITKRVNSFIAKRGKGYCKTRQVLQNEAKVISKRGRYYKTR